MDTERRSQTLHGRGPMNAWDRCYLAATEQDRLESWLCAQAAATPRHVPSLLAFESAPPDALREGGTIFRPTMTKEPGYLGGTPRWRCACGKFLLARERGRHNAQRACSYDEVFA